MLACDTSVTTACACAKVKRAPCDASASRFGVAALPPYDPSASARSVSIVTSRILRSGFGATVNALPPLHAKSAAAKSTTGDQERKRPGGVPAASRHPDCLLSSLSPGLL